MIVCAPPEPGWNTPPTGSPLALYWIGQKRPLVNTSIGAVGFGEVWASGPGIFGFPFGEMLSIGTLLITSAADPAPVLHQAEQPFLALSRATTLTRLSHGLKLFAATAGPNQEGVYVSSFHNCFGVTVSISPHC